MQVTELSTESLTEKAILGKRLKIILCNPPSPDGFVYIRDINRSGRRSREGTRWPQTSLAMIAAVLSNHDVEVWDCITEGWNYQDTWNKLNSTKPDWVILESVSSTISHDAIIGMYAHSLGAKTILISPHGKALNQETQLRFPFIDHVLDYGQKIDGEPEYVIRELITGEVRQPHETFETLPPARQDLLPLQKYDLPLIGKGYTFVVTSRGCPFKCIYCRTTVTWESKVRYRPVESILEEIRRYHLTNIAFHADTATVNRRQMLAICEGIKSLPWKVRWICNSRVDTVDLEMLQAMKSAGCWMICFGIESGDDRVLAMNKKEATVADAIQAVTWAKEAGLKVWGYFMLGLYGETCASMERTRLLARRLPCDIVNFAIAAPYPGTEWGRIADTNGWLTNNGRWESYDQNYSAIVDQPDCSHDEVLRMQRRAYLSWYLSWRGLKFLMQAWRPLYARFFYHLHVGT